MHSNDADKLVSGCVYDFTALMSIYFILLGIPERDSLNVLLVNITP